MILVLLGNRKCCKSFVSAVCIVSCILIVHLCGMMDGWMVHNVCLPVLSLHCGYLYACHGSFRFGKKICQKEWTDKHVK